MRYLELKDPALWTCFNGKNFPIGVNSRFKTPYFPIGKDSIEIQKIFLYGKPQQEMLDVQVRT